MVAAYLLVRWIGISMFKFIAFPLAFSIGFMLTAFAPAGVVEATVPDAAYAPKLLGSCLAGTEVPAFLTYTITNEPDGDDVQRVIFQVHMGVHEDTASCIHDAMVAWAG